MIEISNISSHVTPLLKHIHAECDSERNTLEATTEAEISEIQSTAEAQKQELWESGIAGLKQQELDIVQSTLKHARLDCDLRVKRRLSQATERLLASAKEALSEFAEGDAFEAILRKLVAETLITGESLRPASGGSMGTLRVPPRHEQTVKSIITSHDVTVDIVPDADVKDGVVLSIEGTRYTITNTLSSRLIKRENHIRMAIAKLLNAKVAENN